MDLSLGFSQPLALCLDALFVSMQEMYDMQQRREERDLRVSVVFRLVGVGLHIHSKRCLEITYSNIHTWPRQMPWLLQSSSSNPQCFRCYITDVSGVCMCTGASPWVVVVVMVANMDTTCKSISMCIH